MLPDADAWFAWGQRLGAHAWPAFAVALAALLLALAAPARWLTHTLERRRRTRAEAAQGHTLLLALALGFALVVGLSFLFARLAEGLGEGRAMGRMDLALSRAIGEHTPRAVLQAMALFTHLGDPAMLTAVCVLVAAGLWWRGQRTLALGWVLAVGGNAVLNTTLKQVFARVRPLHDAALASAPGFSFPSGHSSGALVLWGMLAYVGLRLAPPRHQWPLLLLALALVLGIAASRVFLQVHYLSDVLAGLCSGSAWLTVCIASLELARRRRVRLRLRPG